MDRYQKDYEVDNVTGRNHEGPNANAPVRRLTATSIIGDKIENLDGDDLGKIDNLMINLQSGEIEYVVVEFGSFLGMGGKLFAVPYKHLVLNKEKECFTLNRDKEHFKNMPGFDRNHWPDTNDHTYYQDVDVYWGATVDSGRVF
ncbi:MAG TPA: PRC-barrel domain-containing protein [Chryseolinea sp.]|nr:PRC-barrel domain-containing protein [Chryseolinea sp.]